MKPIWEASGETSERPLEKQEQNEGEARRSNLFSESYCRNGTVWAEVVNDVEAGTLHPLITQQVSPRDLSSVLIPGGRTQVSHLEDLFIDW